MDPRRIFGNSGEDFAADFLKEKGYQILKRQYSHSVGEIDLICRDGDEVVFVEVKARRSQMYGYPEDSVTNKKIGNILRVADLYLSETKQSSGPWRIDVVSIEYHVAPPKVTHLIGIDIPERFW
jgi:putative endonuclease